MRWRNAKHESKAMNIEHTYSRELAELADNIVDGEGRTPRAASGIVHHTAPKQENGKIANTQKDKAKKKIGLKSIFTLNKIASVLYVYAVWEKLGFVGLIAAVIILAHIVGFRLMEHTERRTIGRNEIFWLDMVYAAILMIPFLMR